MFRTLVIRPVLSLPRKGFNGNTVLYYSFAILIFFGGVLMLLLVGGILSIQNEDPLNLFLNQSTELFLFGVLGAILIGSPFWLVPYIRKTLKQKNTIKVEVSHHSRNKIQVILNSLELLEASATTEDQILLIRQLRLHFLAMIDSLSEAVESDGQIMDYSDSLKARN